MKTTTVRYSRAGGEVVASLADSQSVTARNKRRSLTIVAALLAVLSSASVGATPIQFAGTGHYYELINDVNRTWKDARDDSLTKSFMGVTGHLVTLFTKAENDFVFDVVMNQTSPAWIGATDEANEGTWKWVTGEHFWEGGAGGSPQNGLFTNWHLGQPDNALGTEHYAHFWIGNTWNDIPNSQPFVFSYVIEYDTVPEPTTVALLGLGLAGLGFSAKRKKLN